MSKEHEVECPECGEYFMLETSTPSAAVEKPSTSDSGKAHKLPYYKRYVEFPNEPRPNEPCNDFEHPVRWALVAYWEKARADKANAERDELVALLESLANAHEDEINEEWHGISSYKEKIEPVVKARAAIEKARRES